MSNINPLPQSGMSMQDSFMAWFLMAAALAMLVISAINFNVILASSGNPDLLENEFKRFVLSLLAPLSSIILKLIPMMFEYPAHRKSFVKALFSVTALIVLLWVWMVSQTFSGMGGDIDFTAIMSGDTDTDTDDGSLYLFIQLLMEILLGACFLTGWFLLLEKYTPEPPNPRAHKLDKQIAVLDKLIAQARQDEEDAALALANHQTRRAKLISTQHGKLSNLKAQLNLLND